MSLLLRVSLLLVALAPAVACTQAGGSCNKTGFLCEDPETALECQDGKWVALPCRGPEGCVRQDSDIVCDTSRNVAGDACASSAEGRGLCAQDGRAVIECRNGTFVQTRTCSSCTESGGQIVCQP